MWRHCKHTVSARRVLPLAVLGAATILSACRSPPSTWVEPWSGIRFRLVPAGRFLMGSPPAEIGREPQEAQHEVVLSRPLYVGETEVTQGQWRRVMGTSPSWFRACGDDCPVERVTWYDAQAFAARLSRLAHRTVRLPTEAEWEHACRAGTTTPFSTGASIDTAQANYDGEGPYAGAPPGRFRRAPVPVRSFPPNAFGLYDLHGNVWEWTSDWLCPYPTGTVTDPRGAACATDFKVIRGGSFYFDAASTRCALRYTHRPEDRGFSLGLRVVADPP